MAWKTLAVWGTYCQQKYPVGYSLKHTCMKTRRKRDFLLHNQWRNVAGEESVNDQDALSALSVLSMLPASPIHQALDTIALCTRAAVYPIQAFLSGWGSQVFPLYPLAQVTSS